MLLDNRFADTNIILWILPLLLPLPSSLPLGLSGVFYSKLQPVGESKNLKRFPIMIFLLQRNAMKWKEKVLCRLVSVLC